MLASDISENQEPRTNNTSTLASFAMGLVATGAPILIASFLRRPKDQLNGWVFWAYWAGLFLVGCILAVRGYSRPWKLGFAAGLGLPTTIMIRFLVGFFMNRAQPYLYFAIFHFELSFVLAPIAVFSGMLFVRMMHDFRR
jgi:hypothetical protein